MSHDPQLSVLLKQWEERRQRGQIVSAEELCRYCPELVGALARRIDVLQAQSSESVNTISEATVLPSVALDELSSFGAAGYQIIRELGRGGMGIVYEAFDGKRQRTVALKTFRNIDSSALYRFKQEFRALADVTHPNLVPLFELISDGSTWFFTMELIHGINFLNYVWADAPRTSQLARIRDALRQLAEGIVALHDAGKLHRDIKPSNVLVTREGRLVLLDFGLAADLEATGAYQSADEEVVGTAAYMAPEQATGDAVSPASDWYSVGVMLYETFTRRRPFVGPRSVVLLDKQRVDPPAPCALAPDIPDDLNALCVELLRRRPENRPAGRDVIRRLRYEPAPPAASGPAPPLRTPFVGREQHLTALYDAFLTTRQGQAVTLFVQGRSGQGKSALVQRFLAGLQERDEAVVLAGRCYERESVPYKAMDSLVDNLSHYLARLPHLEAAALLPRDILALARVFPVLRHVTAVAEVPPGPIDTPDRQGLRRLAFTALRELLTGLGARRPLVLFIDDLQWGDADSALLLSELLRPPDPPVLLFLGSFRSEDAATSPMLRLLLQRSAEAASPCDRRELIVDDLTRAEARQLALLWLGEDILGARAHAEAIAAESGGNPLFLGELVRSYQAASGPEQPALGAEIVLGEVLWARIERLPPEARNLLEILAVAGRPLPQATAARAAGLEGEERTLLGMLRTGHLVRGTGSADLDEVETYHDRIRETVVAHLPAAALMHRHGRLANTLETLGHPDPETLAVHFLGATDRGKAGHYYALAAAKAAETLAFDRSANLYRMALELLPMAEGEARDLRTKLGDSLANAGRGAEAAREYETAAAAAVPEALDLKRRAAYQYLISGHFDAGCAAIGTVLRAVGMKLPATPLRALGSLLWRRAWLRLRGLRFRERAPAAVTPAERTRLDICFATSAGQGVIDIIRAADFQTRYLLLALRAGDAFHIARALALEAVFNAAGGGRTRQRTAKLLAAAAELAARIRNPYIDAVVRMAQGAVAFLEGRFPDALVRLVEADEIFRNQCTGVAWEIDTSLTHRVVTLVLTGQIRELNRLGPFRLRDAQERGDLCAATNLGAYVMPLLRLAADDPDGARAVVSQAMAQWSQKGFHLQHLFAMLSETEICLYQGQGLAAWNQLSTHWPAYTRSQLTHVQMSHFQALFARARSAVAASAGAANPQRFWTAAQRDARALERADMPWSLALARLIRAGISGAQGDRRSACEQLARVIDPLEQLHGQLYAAAARWCLGRLQSGAAGCSLQAQAEAWMTAEQIRNPARMAGTVLPGLSTESA